MPEKYEIAFCLEVGGWALVIWECEKCHKVELWNTWLRNGYITIPSCCPQCGSVDIRMTVEDDPFVSEDTKGGDVTA